ncbi:MAG: cytosine methyltransferase [Micrococcaceae bacterium]|jgi:DNA (cytosine-5)-methyltransferase 1|nr:cytosine methyltransferase [Micrococcaceae bacterium]
MTTTHRQDVQQKIRRLADGAEPRVLDLFSGCGGLSLGFTAAGGRSLGGVELDEHAAATHSRNFHGSSPLHARALDICAADPLALLAEWGAEAGEQLDVDVLVGGPPCPTFTRVGRAKLREVAQHPEAFKVDKRTELYLHFLRFVQELQPLAVLVENVPDILNHGGINVGEVIASHLETLGYDVGYSLLNSVHYGVPQMRERFILVGYRAELGASISFPVPSHTVQLPRGYAGTRDVALKLLRPSLAATPLLQDGEHAHHYVQTPDAPSGADPAVTARQAMADLPPLLAHLEGLDRRGARRFETGVPYEPAGARSPYAQQLVTWPGFAGDGHLYDHATRCLSARDYRLFARMQAGDDYPKAHALAQKLWAEETGSAEHLRKAYIPPYDATKFPNKWRKMEPDLPARTLMAHLGKDTYSHIHYDSRQARTISVREAARLQSFPDGFRFCGTMNPAFRQIGNSVPPLFAAALGRTVLGSLTAASLGVSDMQRTSA